jgi:hypothetical protein
MAGEAPRHFYLPLDRAAEKWTIRRPTAKKYSEVGGPART